MRRSEKQLAYSYYPGCTLHSTAIEYGWSTEEACGRLGLELRELPDWNCCGASSAHALDHRLGLSLPTRDLMHAQSVGLPLVMPCAACYGRVAAADARMRTDDEWRQEMEAEFGVAFTGKVKPRTLLDVIANDLRREELRARVVLPLSGLRPVAYYGCLLVRPPDLTHRWDDPERPRLMDQVMWDLGAAPLAWSGTVECCGASLALDRADVVVQLSGRIHEMADDAEANCVVCACPLCQANLDSRQKGRAPMPVFYFTELIALALGATDSNRWWRKHLADPRPLLNELGLNSRGPK
jgi:heterodisulfide reductase subunit B2